MSGIFNASIFNNTIFNTGESSAVDVVKTGTGGIDGEGTGGTKRKGIVKPLGTLGLPRKGKKAVEARVDESREIQAEIASRLAREFAEESVALETRPIASMSMAEIDFEIGAILRKQIRTEEDEAALILLMIAAAL